MGGGWRGGGGEMGDVTTMEQLHPPPLSSEPHTDGLEGPLGREPRGGRATRKWGSHTGCRGQWGARKPRDLKRGVEVANDDGFKKCADA